MRPRARNDTLGTFIQEASMPTLSSSAAGARQDLSMLWDPVAQVGAWMAIFLRPQCKLGRGL